MATFAPQPLVGLGFGFPDHATAAACAVPAKAHPSAGGAKGGSKKRTDGSPAKSRAPRWNIPANALTTLEEVFKSHHFPSVEARDKLAADLNVKPRQIQVWFQNRRQRERNEQRKVLRNSEDISAALLGFCSGDEEEDADGREDDGDAGDGGGDTIASADGIASPLAGRGAGAADAADAAEALLRGPGPVPSLPAHARHVAMSIFAKRQFAQQAASSFLKGGGGAAGAAGGGSETLQTPCGSATNMAGGAGGGAASAAASCAGGAQQQGFIPRRAASFSQLGVPMGTPQSACGVAGLGAPQAALAYQRNTSSESLGFGFPQCSVGSRRATNESCVVGPAGFGAAGFGAAGLVSPPSAMDFSAFHAAHAAAAAAAAAGGLAQKPGAAAATGVGPSPYWRKYWEQLQLSGAQRQYRDAAAAAASARAKGLGAGLGQGGGGGLTQGIVGTGYTFNVGGGGAGCAGGGGAAAMRAAAAAAEGGAADDCSQALAAAWAQQLRAQGGSGVPSMAVLEQMLQAQQQVAAEAAAERAFAQETAAAAAERAREEARAAAEDEAYEQALGLALQSNAAATAAAVAGIASAGRGSAYDLTDGGATPAAAALGHEHNTVGRNHPFAQHEEAWQQPSSDLFDFLFSAGPGAIGSGGGSAEGAHGAVDPGPAVDSGPVLAACDNEAEEAPDAEIQIDLDVLYDDDQDALSNSDAVASAS
eukprot:CAMPEP_0206035162 /NCGR_PEP_ID=MMETSP1466-20131121/1887_1 /ASSEMBLY_ACC=CAM_ASM_001126 /TAXON_ID=44452 /ORGANISM="Pavlova gyrans, Strain CCMP608" /LENGTH=704 /DNA_ID=CAMNT_0053409513 /DNA_START=149 /DNA_END=2263 /DNA_ORIENTATION=-